MTAPPGFPTVILAGVRLALLVAGSVPAVVPVGDILFLAVALGATGGLPFTTFLALNGSRFTADTLLGLAGVDIARGADKGVVNFLQTGLVLVVVVVEEGLVVIDSGIIDKPGLFRLCF